MFYSIISSIESLSRLPFGPGPFEISPNYKCYACANAPLKRLCLDCQSSYLTEISYLTYSYSFERRIHLRVFLSGLSMGISAFLLNLFWGVFRFDPDFTELEGRLVEMFKTPEGVSAVAFWEENFVLKILVSVLLVVVLIFSSTVFYPLGVVAVFRPWQSGRAMKSAMSFLTCVYTTYSIDNWGKNAGIDYLCLLCVSLPLRLAEVGAFGWGLRVLHCWVEWAEGKLGWGKWVEVKLGSLGWVKWVQRRWRGRGRTEGNEVRDVESGNGNGKGKGS